MRLQRRQLRLELLHLQAHGPPHAPSPLLVERREHLVKRLERGLHPFIRVVVALLEVDGAFVLLGVLQVLSRGGEEAVDGVEARVGVRRLDGGALPAVTIQASVVQPDGAGGRAFLVYDNFRTVMKWNHSTYFALAVGLLGDAIGN